ncbi:MAG: Metalloprotease MmpA [Syntrophorhabdus sp. PtaU1.Bin002]|nr:MAG: Metalloprotease MmpA [Syntrophorhabdus sp. PtaU1.Bin002]
MLSILYGLIALSLLILVHELGHFLVARLADVKVIAFSLGFGKKLFSFRKGETEYALSAVPLGGYVKLLGESPEDEVSPEEINRSYASKKPYVRMLIAFTGPLFNIIFAFVLFYFVFLSGYSVLSTKVGAVETGYPAYTAGIREGDVITAIEGKQIHEWGDLLEIMGTAPQKDLRFTVKRGETFTDVLITPKEVETKNIFGETMKRRVIGVTASNELVTKRETVMGATTKAFYQTYNLSKITIVGIVKLIQGSISPKNIGGPILILEMAGKQAKEGQKNLIYFVAIISINLGVINLLPIPILDGGHILFHLIEIVTRRRPSQKAMETAQKVGMAVLILIMVFAFYNDLDRIFDFKRLIGGK